MEEMQRLISKRSDGTPRRPLGFPQEESPSRPLETPRDETSRTMYDFAVELENELETAVAAFESINSGLRTRLTRSFEVRLTLLFGSEPVHVDGANTDLERACPSAIRSVEPAPPTRVRQEPTH